MNRSNFYLSWGDTQRIAYLPSYLPDLHCEYVLYSIRELFSFHRLKCLQNDILYRKAGSVTDDILGFVFLVWPRTYRVMCTVFVLMFNRVLSVISFVPELNQ
jgi:hypothetical protein